MAIFAIYCHTSAHLRTALIGVRSTFFSSQPNTLLDQTYRHLIITLTSDIFRFGQVTDQIPVVLGSRVQQIFCIPG